MALPQHRGSTCQMSILRDYKKQDLQVWDYYFYPCYHLCFIFTLTVEICSSLFNGEKIQRICVRKNHKKPNKHREKMELTWICLSTLASNPCHPQISSLTAAPSLSRRSETSILFNIVISPQQPLILKRWKLDSMWLQSFNRVLKQLLIILS